MGIILSSASGKLNISNFDTLNINANKTGFDGLTAASSSNIIVSNVNTVNIGTADSPFLSGGQAIHGFFGSVKMENIGDLNINTQSSGIMAQSGDNSTDDYRVDIQANNNININANNLGILVASLATDKHPTKVNIKAGGKISVNATNSALQLFDKNMPPNEWSSNGIIEATIEGDKGVDLISKSSVAVYSTRVNDNISNLNIISKNGDVNAIGTRAVYLNNQDKNQNAILNGIIEGQNINLTSTLNDAVTLAGGTLNLNGLNDNSTININSANGVAARISKNGELNLGDGIHNTDIYTNGNIILEAKESKINFADNTTTHINADKYDSRNTSEYFITNVNNGAVTFGNQARILLENAKKDVLYNIVSDNQIDTSKIISDNPLLKFNVDEHNTVSAKYDKIRNILHGIIAGSIIDKTLADKNDGNIAFDFFNKAVKNNVTNNARVSAYNSVANMGELAGVNHTTYSASNMMTDAVSQHLSKLTHGDQEHDIWAQYIHNKENIDGMNLGGINAKYDAKYNGIIVGSDLYKKGKTTAGVAFSYMDGDIKGNTLAARTENDAQYYGLSLYGRIDNGDSAILGDISYLHSENDIKQYNSGETITASPNADAFSLGVKFEKLYETGEGILSPFAGLRYMHIGTGDYTNSLGINYDVEEQNLWLLPVGISFKSEIKHDDWIVSPYMKAAYIWTFGDRSTDQSISLNGGIDTFGFETADEGSFLGELGVNAENDKMSYGLAYAYQKGDSVKSNKWMANVIFKF